MVEPTNLNSIKAVAPNYTSYHRQIAKRMTIFERTHTWPPNSREVDVFGRCWSLGWLNFSDDQVALHRFGKKLFLNGPLAIFIPPFSIIDTEIKGGEIHWQAIISDLPIENWGPTQATIFPRPANQAIPESFEEVKKFILDYQNCGAQSYIVEKVEIISAIAEKLRQYLNENFEEDTTISEIANRLGYDHAVLNRAFKKAYGISPINYRNKMRVLDSVHKLVLGEMNVTDIGFDVGFTTSRNFDKQFKKIMKLPPSKFKI